MPPASPDEETDDLDDVLDLGSSSRPRKGRKDRGPRVHRAPSTGVRRWKASDHEPWDDVVDDESEPRRREKPPVYWRARDSLYFEPLVALAIIVLLLVSLYAYTSNWPPVYVVESNSMQHGSGDHLGYLNAGDIVLAQRADLGSIVTYVQAEQTGFSTYGDPGDVILYYPDGITSSTPIVHRAIIYLQFDSHNSTYNATGLPPGSCGSGKLYSTPGSHGGCSTTYLSAATTLDLYGVDGRTVTVDFGCPSVLGGHSGFLTLGDNNSQPDQDTQSCAHPLSTLVMPGWVIGVARGLIPWFGDLKLLLDGNAGNVSPASWEYLGLTIAGVIFAATGLHVLLRRRRQERRAVRRKDEAREDEEEPEPPPSRARRAPSAVRPWRAPDEGPEPDGAPPARLSYAQRRRSHFASSREPRPERRRRRAPHDPDDDDGSPPAS